jgi:tetratricopeptide (TPR) repeat protein
MAQLLRDAVVAADIAMKLPPVDATTYDTLGVVYSKANLHRQAADSFQRAVELQPDHASYRFNLGTSHMYYGDLEAAEREYECCLALAPGYWRAYLALSQLRRQTPGKNHVERLRQMLSLHGDESEAGLHLHLSLAKELEDLEEFTNAFQHYTRGKTICRDAAGSSAASDAAMFDAIEHFFDHTADGGAGYESDEPIFVMGMPRSGTTLVDRILSTHSAVHSAGELANFSMALQRAGGGPARSIPETLANLGPGFSRWSELGRAYVESTRPGTGHSPRFVDKLPHNFLYTGFIARALPNAKLICLQRGPLDTCLSNFRQLFALESPDYNYSFDLLDTGRYFLRFRRLMEYWKERFPGRILEVNYEQLVDAQEDVTRRIVEFCELPWERACLSFESNDAPVPTASAPQVRSAMNRSSLQRWRNYESELSGLRRLLEEGGVAPEAP